MKLFIVSQKDPAVRYEVLDFNAVTGEMSLQGKYKKIVKTKAEVKKAGYKLVQESDDAKSPRIQTRLSAGTEDELGARRAREPHAAFAGSPFGDEEGDG